MSRPSLRKVIAALGLFVVTMLALRFFRRAVLRRPPDEAPTAESGDASPAETAPEIQEPIVASPEHEVARVAAADFLLPPEAEPLEAGTTIVSFQKSSGPESSAKPTRSTTHPVYPVTRRSVVTREPVFVWHDVGFSLTGAASWLPSDRLELHGEHVGKSPAVYINTPPEVRDLEGWSWTETVGVQTPSGILRRLDPPRGSRLSLQEALKGEESGLVEIALLDELDTPRTKALFGFCPGVERIRLERDYDKKPFLRIISRTPIVIRIGVEDEIELPAGEHRLKTSVLTGERLTIRTVGGLWVEAKIPRWW